jgi:hypothetical protein
LVDRRQPTFLCIFYNETFAKVAPRQGSRTQYLWVSYDFGCTLISNFYAVEAISLCDRIPAPVDWNYRSLTSRSAVNGNLPLGCARLSLRAGDVVVFVAPFDEPQVLQQNRHDNSGTAVTYSEDMLLANR